MSDVGRRRQRYERDASRNNHGKRRSYRHRRQTQQHFRERSWHSRDRNRRFRSRSHQRDLDRSENRRNSRRRHEKYRSRSRYSRSRSHSRSSNRSSSSSSIDDDLGHYAGRVGSVLSGRYTIQEELGKGTFGKVYKCHDNKHNDYVAIKVVRSIPRYLDSALIEAGILNDIYQKQRELRRNCCVKMFSHFRLDGHMCMVFETLGLSLYDVIKRNDYKRLPLSMVRDVSRQLLETMSFLKRINLVHTDLKLENVLFVHSTLRDYSVVQDGKIYTISAPENTRIKLIDFGGATYDNDPHKSRIINTRQYRGPEVILELGWSFPSDLWSIGCIIGEIYRGDLLFQTHEEVEHLALIEKLCGEFPSHMRDKCSHRQKYFHRDGRVRLESLPRNGQEFVRDAKSFTDFFSLEKSDLHSGIVSLVQGLLQIDPTKRLTADDALQTASFLFAPCTDREAETENMNLKLNNKNTNTNNSSTKNNSDSNNTNNNDVTTTSSVSTR